MFSLAGAIHSTRTQKTKREELRSRASQTTRVGVSSVNVIFLLLVSNANTRLGIVKLIPRAA